MVLSGMLFTHLGLEFLRRVADLCGRAYTQYRFLSGTSLSFPQDLPRSRSSVVPSLMDEPAR